MNKEEYMSYLSNLYIQRIREGNDIVELDNKVQEELIKRKIDFKEFTLIVEKLEKNK